LVPKKADDDEWTVLYSKSSTATRFLFWALADTTRVKIKIAKIEKRRIVPSP